jgi:enoyl-CoA hydratase
MPGTPPAYCRRHGRIGRITLNRPAVINALDLPMIRTVSAALRGWEDDPDIALVLLDGAGDRGFCAGGDIRVVRESAQGDPQTAAVLWREEYELDALIAHYPRPVAVVMDGITMGGGVGLGAHADLRIVTERTVMAMPEVAIGLAPDVGSALLLARSPGELGTHLALTAARIGPYDAVDCGLADYVLAASRLASLAALLGDSRHPAEAAALQSLIAREAAEPGGRHGELIRHRPWIDACYSAGTVEEILDALRRRPEPAAAHAAAAIESASPLALKVTLRALRAARSMTTIDECLVQDYRVSRRFLDQHDLSEGIRAAVVDKDRSPRWKPPALSGVTPEMVTRHFAPLGAEDLSFPAGLAADGPYCGRQAGSPTR